MSTYKFLLMVFPAMMMSCVMCLHLHLHLTKLLPQVFVADDAACAKHCIAIVPFVVGDSITVAAANAYHQTNLAAIAPFRLILLTRLF